MRTGVVTSGVPRLGTARLMLACALALSLPIRPAGAASAASCGGFAALGGAALSCSHVDPDAPTQSCTFSWALLTTGNAVSVVEGAFLLAPGSTNLVVYQGSGFASALSNPIVLCQGRKTDR